MIKIKIDNKTSLVVDFEGLLSPREEEATAYRFTGKSQSAVGEILGVAKDTVRKQQRRVYEKADVDGTDNPLVSLMGIAFQHGWAKFVVSLMLVLCIAPTLRIQARTSARSSTLVARATSNRWGAACESA